MSRPDRKAMLDRDRRGLSIRRQCVLLSLARSGIYRPQRPANDDDLVLMRRIDQLFLAWPFLGCRRMTAMLRAEGLEVNRKRVRRLMRPMGIAALGPKPRTTKPQHGHKIFPYLLPDLVIERPNQVWAAESPTSRSVAAFFIWSPSSTGFRARYSPGGSPTRWTLRFVSTHWKRRSPAGAGPRSSPPTRAASSPVPPSPAHWWRPGSGFRWTAAAAGSTTSSSNACGAR